MQDRPTTLSVSTENGPATGTRFWLWFNLLSLDAPLIAVLWQALFARCFDAPVHLAAFAALALAVWFIYVSDRLLDALRKNDASAARHRFYRQYWNVFAGAAVSALFALGWVCAKLNPMVLRNGLVMLAAILAYFAMVHVIPENIKKFWPKELAVAVLFALGTCLATWTRTAQPHRVMILPLVLFTALCWLNCGAIEYWEWKAEHHDQPHALTLWLGPHLDTLAFAILAAAALLLSTVPTSLHPLLSAALLSAAALFWLDRNRKRFSAEALRVLVDVSLLSPLVLLFLTSGS